MSPHFTIIASLCSHRWQIYISSQALRQVWLMLGAGKNWHQSVCLRDQTMFTYWPRICLVCLLLSSFCIQFRKVFSPIIQLIELGQMTFPPSHSYPEYKVWSKVICLAEDPFKRASNSRLFTTSMMQLNKELLMFAMSFISCCSRSTKSQMDSFIRALH